MEQAETQARGERGGGAAEPPAAAVAPPGPAVRHGVQRLKRHLAETGRGQRGDHDLNPDMAPDTGGTGRLREAAVLVPLVDRGADGITVLFTQRTAHLAAHGGQISFPGGQLEPHDDGPEAAALRETEEEIGLSRDRVDLLGRLNTYLTRTGFRVVPVVGLVRPPFDLVPDPYEVAEVFEVPLAVILGPGMPHRESRVVAGQARFFYVFPYRQRMIWGATAGMLVNLRDVLREVS